ncbi:hypothetical protein ACSVIJ_20290 [Pseudomonas sp. NCHU5208]|uniref:hypothetical protein n=1 Tax=unclassified Pseudomonas TaxID=196821 RepID=UPI003F9A22AA
MPFLRLFLPCAAFASCLLCSNAVAGQLNGSLSISLTVLKRCEISLQVDDVVWQLQGDGCEHAVFHVRDGQGRALPLSRDSHTPSLRLDTAEAAQSSLEVYW